MSGRIEIAIRTIIGTGLTKESVGQLQNLLKPALLIKRTLVLTELLSGLWTSGLMGIDLITSLLGAAPGGISGMSLVGSEFGVGAAVGALNPVRIITGSAYHSQNSYADWNYYSLEKTGH